MLVTSNGRIGWRSPRPRTPIPQEVVQFSMSVDRDLQTLVGWLADRGQITFPRHHAPVLQLSDGLDPGAVVMAFQGTIPNQKGVPVVQE
jgi:hypothetical protein